MQFVTTRSIEWDIKCLMTVKVLWKDTEISYKRQRNSTSDEISKPAPELEVKTVKINVWKVDPRKKKLLLEANIIKHFARQMYIHKFVVGVARKNRYRVLNY